MKDLSSKVLQFTADSVWSRFDPPHENGMKERIIFTSFALTAEF